MKFAISYSGGKESALSLYRAIKLGHTPILLITTFNADRNHSYTHGIDEAMLSSISDSLGIPYLPVKTTSEEYARDFEKALTHAKNMGAEACVFGDIDIEGHRTWCSERCENVGMEPLFPLWGEDRTTVVHEFIDTGFIANITVVNTKHISDTFLGKQLTKELTNSIAAVGADICGENGEYHTFVSDGPIFNQPVSFEYGEKIREGDYAMLPLKASVVNNHRFFNNHDCKYFPCHKAEAPANRFNCLFCYCPLYAMGDKCSGNFSFSGNGIKLCMDCYFPHKPESYDIIIEKLKDWKPFTC